MTTSIRIFSLGIILTLILSACSLFTNPGGNNPVQPNPQANPVAGLSLIVSYNTTIVYNAVGQEIGFAYLVGNTSGAPIPGPITVTDDRVPAVSCPDLTLVGNLDPNLDTDEALSCTGIYAITQLDLNAGTVTNVATATASGNSSLAVPTTVTLEQNRALTLAKTPDPLTYDVVGDTIIYNYVITNSGNVSLGPAQFTITDDKISTVINCGTGDTSLPPAGTVTCSATYLITQADVTAGSVTNTASASDGTTTSSAITAAINRGGTTIPPSSLTPGSTIQHTVVSGEWLWQIARCYGANPKQVIAANLQLPNPAKITPGVIVTVPNIGSERTIFGPQPGNDSYLSCVPRYTIQSGDTWASIANHFSASSTLLQNVNPGIALLPGNVVRVPINSEGDP